MGEPRAPDDTGEEIARLSHDRKEYDETMGKTDTVLFDQARSGWQSRKLT